MNQKDPCTGFSILGAYHMQNQLPNQDRVRYVKTPFVEAVLLADGASSCRFGGEGAQRVLEAAAGLLQTQPGWFFSGAEEELGRLLGLHLRSALKSSLTGGRLLSEYAATFCMAVRDREDGQLLAVNLGDGLIARFSEEAPEDAELLLPPERPRAGQPVLITAADCGAHFRVRRFSASPKNTLLLASDGFWRLFRARDKIDLPALCRASAEPAAVKAREPFDDCTGLRITFGQEKEEERTDADTTAERPAACAGQ